MLKKSLSTRLKTAKPTFVTLDLKALYPQIRLLGTTRLKTLVVGNIPEMTPAPDAVRAQMAKNGDLLEIPTDTKHLSFEELLNNDGKYVEDPIPDLRETIASFNIRVGRPDFQRERC